MPATRRVELQDQLVALRKERGLAVMEGRVFDHNRILQAEAEIQSLDDAEAVAADRDREAQAIAAAERRAERIAEVRALEKQRLESIGSAEQAIRDFTANITAAHRAGTAEAILLAELGGTAKNGASDVAFATMATRLSDRAGAVLATGVHKHRWGGMQWHTMMPHQPTDNWVEKERDRMAPYFAALTKGH